MKKRIDLGEYVITIDYDEKIGKLDVRVLDENGDIIEGLLIVDDNEEEPTIGPDINLN